MELLTRRTFFKLASSLCGAAMAGLIKLPEAKQIDKRLLAIAKAAAEHQSCTSEETFQHLLDDIRFAENQWEVAERMAEEIEVWYTTQSGHDWSGGEPAGAWQYSIGHDGSSETR